jgi:hypothetical protein
MKIKLKRVSLVAGSTLAMVGLFCLVAFGETVYVKSRSALILDVKDPIKARKTQRVYYGQRLERIEKGGRYDKVRLVSDTSGAVLIEGYIRSVDLSRKRMKRTTVLSGRKRTSMTSTGSVFTAGSRQLGPLGTQYAKENNLQVGQKVVEEVMDKMAPDDKSLEAFQRAGLVGDFAVVGGGQ